MYTILAGGYDREGFAVVRFDGSSIAVERKIPAVNPSYILAEKSDDRIYTVEETGDGMAASWKREGGTYVCDSKLPTFGSAPCHVSRVGNVLLLSNYGSGSVARCVIAQDGTLSRALPLIVNGPGSGVVKGRQETSHAHFAQACPGGRYTAVCDLGMDCVLFIESDTVGDSEPRIIPVRVPDGCGPRHAAFRTDGDVWYVACELSSELLVYRGYAQNARLLDRIALTSGIANAPAAIRLSPDERELIVSNRGEDTISVFDVSQGNARYAGKFSACAEQPRDAAYSPDGKYIAVACQKGGALTVFSRGTSGWERVCATDIEQVSCAVWL